VGLASAQGTGGAEARCSDILARSALGHQTAGSLAARTEKDTYDDVMPNNW
jgi:hypothetical protein